MKRVNEKPINKVNKKKDKKFSLKLLLGFILFQLIFTVVTAPFVLLYGPFENAKKTYVGSAMATMSNQWLATTFLSNEKIDKILGTNKSVGDTETQDSSLIEIPKAKDDNIEYQIIDGDKFKGHVLIIHDATRVKVGVSSRLGVEGETVSEIADRYDAVAAINGGYFKDDVGAQQWTSNGGIPTGYLMSEGVEKNNAVGNEKTPIVAITKEGKLLVGDITVSQLLKKNDVEEALSYIDTLVVNGKESPIKRETGSSPRTMIGQRKDSAIVFVVLDSKLPGDRICATLEEAQEVMIKLNCWNAVNLDGGKSATMYLNGEVVNNPSNALGERTIASGFIVK